MNYSSLTIQNNHKKSNNPYVRWVDVRKTIFESIEELRKKGLKCDRIIILGAGSCTDLPMDYICDVFQEITLVDKDDSELLKSLKYTTGFEKKIHKVICDITGLYDNIPQTNSIESFYRILEKRVHIEYIPNELKYAGKYSLVISDLIITQLHLNYFDYANLKYININLQEHTNYLLKFINSLSKKHSRFINNLCATSGKMLILADYIPFGFDFGLEAPFNKILKYNPNIQEYTKKEVEEWAQKYGMPGTHLLDCYLPLLNEFRLFLWQCQLNKGYLCIASTHSYNPSIHSLP